MCHIPGDERLDQELEAGTERPSIIDQADDVQHQCSGDDRDPGRQ